MNFIRLNRDPGITNLFDSGGGAPPDLSVEAAAQAAAAAQEALKTEAYDTDGTTLKEGYKLAEDGVTIIKEEPGPNDPVEGLNEDGTLKEGYEKDADGNVIKTVDPNQPAEVTPDKFFEEVTKLTGREIKVDYPEDMDPLSPEGVAHRDAVLIDVGAQEFEAALAAGDRRAYAYMRHRANGGTDETFFTGNTAFTLPEKTTLEKDADAQANLLRHDYAAKNLDKDSIELLVAAAVKNNTLKDQAIRVHGEIEATQTKQAEEIEKNFATREAAINAKIDNMVTSISTVVEKEMSFVVPETGRAAFTAYIQDNIQYYEKADKFILSQDISTENLKLVLDALYFQYKKGDLKTLVERQAKTKAAQSLRLGGNKVSGPKGGDNTKNNDGNFVPLSSLTTKQ